MDVKHHALPKAEREMVFLILFCNKDKAVGGHPFKPTL